MPRQIRHELIIMPTRSSPSCFMSAYKIRKNYLTKNNTRVYCLGMTIYYKIKNMIAADPLLGKIPDKYLAQKYDVSVRTIWLVRTQLRIPASHQHWGGKYRTKLDMKTIEPLVGKEKDISIAKKYGVSRERIRQIRKKLGIEKYKIPKKVLTK